MDTGEVVKIHKNVPTPIPVQLPEKNGKKRKDGNTTNPDIGIPVQIPNRKKEEVKV